jgi:hypothetical protein
MNYDMMWGHHFEMADTINMGAFGHFWFSPEKLIV